MDLDDDSFLNTAITVVARYGMKRATMAELASAAGVSRQTLYDRFGDKDGVMAAAIDHMAKVLAGDLRAAFSEHFDLTDKLTAYFKIAVWPAYEMMQTMPDTADFEKGMGVASIAATRRMSDTKQAILAKMLCAYLPTHTRPTESVAAFIEQSSSRAKMSDISRKDLESFLSVLRASVVALAHNP
jgi:AcrR family transcriptional regulator